MATCIAATVDPYEYEQTSTFLGSGSGRYGVLNSGTRVVHTTRMYDPKGLLRIRKRDISFENVRFTNPLTGKVLQYRQHKIDVEGFAVPGGLDAATLYTTGYFIVTAPGYGTVLKEVGSGIIGSDGNAIWRHGGFDYSDYLDGDTARLANLCAALG